MQWGVHSLYLTLTITLLQFKLLINRVLGRATISGSKIAALHTGDEIFPAMLNAPVH